MKLTLTTTTSDHFYRTSLILKKKYFDFAPVSFSIATMFTTLPNLAHVQSYSFAANNDFAESRISNENNYHENRETINSGFISMFMRCFLFSLSFLNSHFKWKKNNTWTFVHAESRFDSFLSPHLIAFSFILAISIRCKWMEITFQVANCYTLFK